MTPLTESFDILRVRVEARISLPAIILLSAAMRGDGTTSVACGLARAFAAEGHRTLLLDGNAAHAAVADELGVAPLPAVASTGSDLGARNGEVPYLSLAAVPSGASRELQLNDLLRNARELFAVTIVDAGPLPASSAAVAIARRADAIVLAVRLGRRASQDDREAGEIAGERLIGVVPTRARGLRTYRSDEQRAAAAAAASLRTIVPSAGAVR